jgi:Flp pilus assembly protein TadD
MRIGKNTPWLVKSSGRILGPFYENEIISLLRTREIVLIDELSRPCGRWVYIRDELAFAAIAEELRQKNLKTLNDETTAQIENTGATPTQTISVTENLLDDRTEEISNIIVQNPHHGHQTIKDVMGPRPSQQRTQNPNSKPSISDDTYVFEGDRLVQKESHTLSKLLWAITAVVIFSSVGYVAFRQYISKPIQIKATALASLDKAEQMVTNGDYPSAFALYKKAHLADSQDMRMYLPLAILYVQIERQTVQAKRLLDSLLANQEKERQKILTAMGLAELVDRRYPEAEIRFTRALEVDPLFKPALINLGATSLLAGDAEKANNYLQIAIKDGSREGIEQIMAVDALTQLFQKEKDKSYLQQADRFLTEYLKPYQPYYLESLVASIYVSYLLEDKEKMYSKINLFLDSDFIASDLHKYNLYVHKGALDWKKINQWCLKSTELLDPISRVVAFEAICLLKAGDLSEASRKIEDAVQQTPRDSLVQATYGYILENLNSADRAKTAFERAVDFDRGKTFQAPRIHMARFCEQHGQADCAFNYWNELLTINQNSLPALAGLYEIASSRSQTEQASQYRRRGQVLAPTYMPFFGIRRE